LSVIPEVYIKPLGLQVLYLLNDASNRFHLRVRLLYFVCWNFLSTLVSCQNLRGQKSEVFSMHIKQNSINLQLSIKDCINFVAIYPLFNPQIATNCQVDSVNRFELTPSYSPPLMSSYQAMI